jgi:DNA-binding NtrC family response regulator
MVKILYVEDNPGIQTSTLWEYNASFPEHEFVAASNAETAGQLLANGSFDGALLDWRFSGGGGLALLKQIASMDHPIPAIVSTSSDLHAVRDAIAAANLGLGYDVPVTQKFDSSNPNLEVDTMRKLLDMITKRPSGQSPATQQQPAGVP